MKTFTVGKLSAEAGINIETVRYYENVGLMPEPRRTKSGYRIYSEADLKRLHFINKAKNLGFTLREIKELLHLRVDDSTSCDDVRSMAENKIEQINNKISQLTQIKNSLKKLSAQCHTGLGKTDCPILENLED